MVLRRGVLLRESRQAHRKSNRQQTNHQLFHEYLLVVCFWETWPDSYP
jgi:hypothetical protein